MDWDKLRVFHAVAEAGSFTHAGDVLHLSQSAVSRQVSALEESVHCTLFHRHARGLLLTEQGELLYHSVHDVFNKLATTQAMLQDSQNRPQGTLRITTTVALGSLWLTPRLRLFLDKYPDIQVTLITTDQELDLGMRQADCAIRLTPPHQPDLVKRNLVRVHNHVYASPEYVEQRGAPQNTEELEHHRLIVYGDGGAVPVPSVNWLLKAGASGKARRPVLKVNNVYGILQAVQSGLGIAMLPDYLAHESDNLVRILPEVEGPTSDAYFVYPEELRHSQRIQLFRDFLLREVAGTHF